MVDLNELQYFVQVSKDQSFTLAAKHLGVAKSNISRAILRLEERLGVRLLERTTRSVALTEVGELYLDRCQRVLEEAEEAELLIDAAGQPARQAAGWSTHRIFSINSCAGTERVFGHISGAASAIPNA